MRLYFFNHGLRKTRLCKDKSDILLKIRYKLTFWNKKSSLLFYYKTTPFLLPATHYQQNLEALARAEQFCLT